ncbi:hypothetical protein BegalDRAFT_2774 [Beggiatoa alba B18LD]|uniref:Uncharacterized protein n=1 Tax=Beggiatoa alba B18LD TaxID=395493 RepID=I3CJ16_9GAMM|nr:hypothetical protein [Beggiatoa alba]EIJ43609.1 hypothetical protein BegalDRAFT_2774 [Beggiatoa alba B18LD]
MNRLSPSIVLVKKIHCAIPRQQFAVELIETAAELILKLGGVITPLILRRKGADEYELEHGALEYYAALRAKELNLQQGESINAYIVDDHDERSLLAQVQLFRQTSNPLISNISTTQPLITEDFEQKVNAFSTQLMQTMQKLLVSEITQFKATLLNTMQPNIKESEESKENTVTVTTVLKDELSKPETQEIKELTPQPPVTKRKITKKTVATTAETVIKETVVNAENNATPAQAQPIALWLTQLNQLPDKELFVLLTRQKLKKDLIEQLVATRPFDSEEALKKIKGIGAATLKKIQSIFNG